MKDTPETPNGGGYDLIVIGAGSAGFSAAITAAESGAQVVLIGHGTIGGTCVNVGCVPSKFMIRAAQTQFDAREASRFAGIHAEADVTDWPALVQAKRDLVGALRQKKYIDILPQYDAVTYVQGAARLEGGDVRVGNALFSAPKVLIATGGRPAIPDIAGLEDVDTLDSTSLLELDALPESLMVLGGGYVGVELAQVMSRLGVRVTIVCRSRLLPQVEPEVSDALTSAFVDEGILVVRGIAYDSVRQDESGVALRLIRNGKPFDLTAQKLVLTTGRVPNTDGMGLNEAGVDTNPHGAITISDDMQTSKPGVYAAGDVTDRDQFVYMAAYGAKVAINNALALEPMRYDNSTMAWVVFSDPQVAGVGLTEAGARAAGHEVKTSVLGLEHVPRALAAMDTRGVIKLVADAKTDRLLGGQIIAPEGSDTVQTLVMALKFGMTTKALGETIFPYLTTVEGLKLAAQTFDKDVAKLSCCAG